MFRDELIKALEAQPHDTDVQLSLGGFLVDIVRVDTDNGRCSIVLTALTEDVESVMAQVAKLPSWRAGGVPRH